MTIHCHSMKRHFSPAYTAFSPSSSSMRSSWLYLALRSERQGAPVLIWPVDRPTAKSAMKQSSVSPDLWLVITPQPASLDILTASMDSVREPIWLTFRSKELTAFCSMPRLTRMGFVTSMSSPTTWQMFSAVRDLAGSQSSCSKGSSMEMTGYLVQNSLYISSIWAAVFLWEPSLGCCLKFRSYILSSVMNSDAATSMPILTLPVYPAFSMASVTKDRPSSLDWMLGAKPPSSPTLVASWPYLALMMPFSVWYTSVPMRMASEKDDAPVGKIMNSCMARALPAWLPPLMMLNAGTGKYSLGLPARSAMCLYRGTSFSAAPALAVARETARIALAPSLALLGVPSRSIIFWSTSLWFLGSMPFRAGLMMVLMLSTAFCTPLPRNLVLSPSRSSTASWMPVEAPEGTAARNMPLWVCTSASTVGLPRESMI
mmetsp:Transcript_5336/g.14340  ORF Transcript_5336/g.14340 Transcript_5336/m.14340 type:complete len:429 (+) Transcript_5336:208-1494(+)